MFSKFKFLLFFIFISFCANAQVKIGQNPNTIDSASIVELESTDKAFVLTRLTTAQMQAISPLNGAVVYNTDTKCVHYFNGSVWTNLCDGNNASVFSFTDNGDGTISLSDGNGNNITFNGAAQTISTLVENGDGTYTYTNENGIETVISIAVTDNQNLQTDNTPGNISIDNGNAIAINVDDADADAQNEIQSLDYTSGVLTLSNDPNTTTVDLSGFDQDATDDFNTGISFDGTNITVSDLGGEVSTDISGLAYDDTALRADVDQNTADIATNVTDISNNATDIDNLEAEQTTQNTNIATNATDIDNLEAEQNTQNTSIANNASDIATNATAIATHNAADGDLSDTNEYNTAISFDGTDLTITDLGGDQTVDISGLSYDDTALRADVDQNTVDIATNVTDISNNATDIDNLEAEQTTQNNDIATNATDIDNLEAEQNTQNTSIANNASDIATNTTAIATHNAADGDLSDTNEYNTAISFDGTDLTITDLGGDQTVDISGLSYDDTALRADVDQNTADIATNVTDISNNATDISNNATDIDNLEAEQTTQNTNIATNATDIDNLEAEQNTQNTSIANNASDIATNTTAIATHNTADGDLSDTNELSDLNLDASNILTLTNPATGSNQVDLSTISTDDQTVEMFAFNDSTFELSLKIEEDPTTQIANLSSLYADGTETEITAGAGITITGDGSSTLPYNIINNFTEVDGSITNETNTNFSIVDVAGTDYLRISDSNGDLDVSLSDLSHTGTTGSIFFADTDGTPTENNSQLFWDATNNRLSIGNPLLGTNRLTVNGATRTSGLNNSDGSTTLPSYRFSDDSDTGIYSPAADEIGIVVGKIEALKVEETSGNTSVIINETLELEGAVLDENDSAGAAGQVLTSTATGTEWTDSMSPIKAIGKISSAGIVTKATAGVSVTRISVGYYRVTLPAGSVSDADYIIQLTQPGRGGVGNDDPGISYSNQTATSFEVIIGDNDNGGTDRARFDSEFMFTVLDL